MNRNAYLDIKWIVVILSGNCPWPNGPVLHKVTSFPEGSPHPMAGPKVSRSLGSVTQLRTSLKSDFSFRPSHEVS